MAWLIGWLSAFAAVACFLMFGATVVFWARTLIETYGIGLVMGAALAGSLLFTVTAAVVFHEVMTRPDSSRS